MAKCPNCHTYTAEWTCRNCGKRTTIPEDDREELVKLRRERARLNEYLRTAPSANAALARVAELEAQIATGLERAVTRALAEGSPAIKRIGAALRLADHLSAKEAKRREFYQRDHACIICEQALCADDCPLALYDAALPQGAGEGEED